MYNDGFLPTSALSFSQFKGERLKKFDTEDDILNAFECFDTEGKGYMDTDDLKDVLSQDGPTKLLDREVMIDLCVD